MRKIKNHNLIVRVTDDESAMVKYVAEKLGLNQSEMVLALVQKKEKTLRRQRKREPLSKVTAKALAKDNKFLSVGSENNG